MKKNLIILLLLVVYGCAVPISIGNKSVLPASKAKDETSSTVYVQNGKTMVAINHILPQRAGQFEMLTKTVILPAIKREDAQVFNSLKFLIPEEANDD